jgi:DNA-binding transcriptional LysR family regulator
MLPTTANSLSNNISRPNTLVSMLPRARSFYQRKRLAAHGHRRRTVITLPYFGAATRCIPETKLILTAPRRFAGLEAENRKIKVLKAPVELTGFKYLMIWHPRVNTDAAHAWLRGEIGRIGKKLSS